MSQPREALISAAGMGSVVAGPFRRVDGWRLGDRPSRCQLTNREATRPWDEPAALWLSDQTQGAVMRTVVRAGRRIAAACTLAVLALQVSVACALAGPTVPAITEQTPPGSDKFETIGGYVLYGGAFCCLMGVFIIGAKMALDHQEGRGAGHHGKSLAMVAIAAVMMGSGGAFVNGLL